MSHHHNSPRQYQVAVILINYNSADFTLECVASIREKTAATLNYQIIVVDNASAEADFAKLAPLATYPEVRLVRSRINLGFSGGNMLGVQDANADYYLFLNNDCVLLNDFLSILYHYAETHPQVGICSGEMFDGQMEYRVNFNYFPSLAHQLFGFTVFRWLNPARMPSRKRRYPQPFEVDLVEGSAMFTRAAAFEAIGGFDTVYFLYAEEEDISYRLKQAGYSTVYVPEAQYQHFVSQSSKDGTAQTNFALLRELYISHSYFWRKHHGYFWMRMMQLFWVFKIGRKFYKHRQYLSIAFFILGGAPLHKSLRHQQKIQNTTDVTALRG
ncbi:glycosyltransferase family 2 protein [Eisenibacter elegans]|jgi:GT2 family glycosyltransferase|uniref:glycosyltransferase family 2 protein n=1 Tax=Eisenibacter elegans TaxID=997 RepID=UPI00041EE1EE|nr:glycosyltransferase family 2 protein [Eisenibacter elegans]